jgi:site-specific recombinase XerD
MNSPTSDQGSRGRAASSQLGIILKEFPGHLRSLGYARLTIGDYARAAVHFGRWLISRRCAPAEITIETVEAFLCKHLRHCRCPRPASRDPHTAGSALRRLFEFLQSEGIVRRSTGTALDPLQQLIERFDRYLVEVHGVAEATRAPRRREALDLLRWRFGQQPLRLARLSAQDLARFVTLRAKQLRPNSTRALADSLRSFVRFLHFEGLCPSGLECAVPTFHSWNRAQLPTVINEGKLRRFLASFDRSTALGRRDYGMALCMCQLGLRVSEVAQMSLDDLDWRQGTLTIPRNKQRREHKLPLPASVAQAIARYLRRGRPPTNSRRVFVRHRTPLGTPLQTGGVRWAMRRGYDCVGIPATGTHLLRRTFATRLHQRGANLKLIADFLGHKDLGTATVYARVNLKQLRSLALPWPELPREK